MLLHTGPMFFHWTTAPHQLRLVWTLSIRVLDLLFWAIPRHGQSMKKMSHKSPELSRFVANCITYQTHSMQIYWWNRSCCWHSSIASRPHDFLWFWPKTFNFTAVAVIQLQEKQIPESQCSFSLPPRWWFTRRRWKLHSHGLHTTQKVPFLTEIAE